MVVLKVSWCGIRCANLLASLPYFIERDPTAVVLYTSGEKAPYYMRSLIQPPIQTSV
jgi:hypothetical protein